MECNICKHKELKNLNLKEKMYGTGEEFLYQECKKCGHIQIAKIPDNLASFYDSNYYSKKEDISLWYNNPLKKYFKKIRSNIKYLIDNELTEFIGDSKYPVLKLLKENKITKNSKILDVGCGNGELLFFLNNMGFTNLSGYDPFIDKDIEFENLKISKLKSKDKNQKYDLIISSHQIEHVPEPLEELNNFKSMLSDNGYLLIRIPVADNDIYKAYGPDWLQLDAPRHLNIFTRESFRQMTEKADLEILKVINDSRFDCIYLSELYSKNISIMEAVADNNLMPSNRIPKYDYYVNEAKKMNDNNTADQISVLLQK
jgi:2-polyprenyl-3-methyl-5-hydroxy-6-metoxy-1,4-benzoquinol methylase